MSSVFRLRHTLLRYNDSIIWYKRTLSRSIIKFVFLPKYFHFYVPQTTATWSSSDNSIRSSFSGFSCTRRYIEWCAASNWTKFIFTPSQRLDRWRQRHRRAAAHQRAVAGRHHPPPPRTQYSALPAQWREKPCARRESEASRRRGPLPRRMERSPSHPTYTVVKH